jgi:hypothetical protein
MNRTLVVCGALAGASIGLVPSAAFATHSVATNKAPKAPIVGHWKVNHTATTDVEAAGGGFVVTAHHRFMRGFEVKLGPDAETACGTGTIHLVGRQRIYDAKGTGEFGSSNEWVVGKNEPTADPVIQPSKVTLGRGGKHFKGRFRTVFTKSRGGVTSGGEIDFTPKGPDGSCQLDFGIKKG